MKIVYQSELKWQKRKAKRSLTEETESSSSSCLSVCPQCSPILSCSATTFKEIVHQGTDLKKRRKVNPNLKRPGLFTLHCLYKLHRFNILEDMVFDSRFVIIVCALATFISFFFFK